MQRVVQKLQRAGLCRSFEVLHIYDVYDKLSDCEFGLPISFFAVMFGFHFIICGHAWFEFHYLPSCLVSGVDHARARVQA
jgi:hypothetical protein